MEFVMTRQSRTHTSVRVALALLVSLAAVAFFLRPATVPVIGGTPRLETDRTEIDLGILPFDRWVTATFRIRNTGDGRLVISNAPRAEAVLGC